MTRKCIINAYFCRRAGQKNINRHCFIAQYINQIPENPKSCSKTLFASCFLFLDPVSPPKQERPKIAYNILNYS